MNCYHAVLNYKEVKMNTRFINARILTMEGECKCIEGELCVVEDRIAYVGPSRLVW